MKKFLVLAVFLFALAYIGVRYDQTRRQELPTTPNHFSTIEAQASHMLGILDNTEDDDPMGHCTGTVIGPHAILSAQHCNKGKGLQLDYALHNYKINKVLKDGRDHVIFLVDGPAFYNIEPYTARSPVLGEKVHIYGSGGKECPGKYRIGKVLDEYNTSEVDRAAGLTYYSIQVIPGDSGSAIYGGDGRIIGVVTYSMSERGVFGVQHMAAFTLNFTPEQIEEAQNYTEGDEHATNRSRSRDEAVRHGFAGMGHRR